VLPDHFAPEVKKIYIDRAVKGKALYKEFCSDCHGIFTKGKDGVPNFTSVQIDNYHATAILGIDPKNHAVARKLSQLQIDNIIIFLRFRKQD
jgi:mono/diheme cytochrome c family protein